jgi:hypothetical protein
MMGLVGQFGPAQPGESEVLLPVDEGEISEGIPDELPVHNLGQPFAAGADDLDMNHGRFPGQRFPDGQGGEPAIHFDRPPRELQVFEMSQGFLDGSFLTVGHGGVIVFVGVPFFEQ